MVLREEVNAWGNYESTARNARTLRRGSLSTPPRRLPSVLLDSVLSMNDGQLNISTNAAVPSKALDISRIVQEEEAHELKAARLMNKPTKMSLRRFFGVYYDVLDPLPTAWTCSLYWLIGSLSGTMAWLPVHIQQHWRYPKFWLFVEANFRGIGQVYFQDSPFSGLLALGALLLQSYRLAVYGFLGLVSGNLVAFFLSFDEGLMGAGLFGYNAMLCGLALGTFDTEYTAGGMAGTVIIGGFSSLLLVALGKVFVTWRIPPLTLPYNISTLMYLAATNNMGKVALGPVRPPGLPNYGTIHEIGISVSQFFEATLRGAGQVYFVDNLYACGLVIVSVMVCSRISAVASIVGSALAPTVGVATGLPRWPIVMGLFGYSPSLTVLVTLLFYAPTLNCWLFALCAGFLTMLAKQAILTLLEPFGLPVLTLAFCGVMLSFLIVQGTTPFVVAIPVASLTIPEEHRRRLLTVRDGYCLLKEAIDTAPVSHASMISVRSIKVTRSIKANLSKASRVWGLELEKQRIQELWGIQKRKNPLPYEGDSNAQEAMRAFQSLDLERVGFITPNQLFNAFEHVGLHGYEGREFVNFVLDLMEIDESSTIGQRDFVAFCLVSLEIRNVCRTIEDFISLVVNDSDSDHVSSKELNSSLVYIGEGALSDVDVQKLAAVNQVNEDGAFDIVALRRFVLLSKIKSLVKEHQERTESMDE